MRDPRWKAVLFLLIGLLSAPVIVVADESVPASDDALPMSVRGVYERVKDAVVVISVSGRDGRSQGMGTGFLISKDGLVVTNRHVVGEGRAIAVQFADGRRATVAAVHATSSQHDLAVLRLEGDDFPFVPLGDSGAIATGEAVLAVGNPQGLTHSVVAGVVSAKREIEGMPMIQLAMPIEPGNSGGPLLTTAGEVVGIVTMKSVVTANLGFAIESNALRPMLDSPNPVPMNRWQTIGSLDPEKWRTLFGSDWRQRAGRIVVEEPGTGFGGRSLCLFHQAPVGEQYEMSVEVRLRDESGAAGIAFASDGGDRHYGFYPSGGAIRLTRFDGPDVYSWSILANVPAPSYVPGDWNQLRLRVEPGRIQGFVNDELVIDSRDASFRGGQVGLAKFRDTSASFRGFTVGSPILEESVAVDLSRFDEVIGRFDERPPFTLERLAPFVERPAAGARYLRRRAQRLELEARRLRTLANEVHQTSALVAMEKAFAEGGDDVDLARAALLIAWLDNDEVDIDAYLAEIDRMAEAIRQELPADAPPAEALATLDRYLFVDHGYHGSRGDYHHYSNSYLNEVIDDREGLPVTLCVLYMELGRRLGLDIVGVGLPGHFIVRFEDDDSNVEWIDVYDRGQRITEDEAKERVADVVGEEVDVWSFDLTNRAIAVRMLRNLAGLARRERDWDALLKYTSAILTAEPDSTPDRWQRAVMLLESDRPARAAGDARWLAEHRPEGIDPALIEQLLERALSAEKESADGGPQ